MKKTLLALGLAVASMPVMFAGQQAPATNAPASTTNQKPKKVKKVKKQKTPKTDTGATK